MTAPNDIIEPGDIVLSTSWNMYHDTALVVAVIHDHNMYSQKFLIITPHGVLWTTRFSWARVNVIEALKRLNHGYQVSGG